MPPNVPRKSSSHPQLKQPDDGPNQHESDAWQFLASAVALLGGLYQAATQPRAFYDGNREETYNDHQSSPSSPTFPGAYPSAKSSTNVSSIVEREEDSEASSHSSKDITPPSVLLPHVATAALASAFQNAHDFTISGTNLVNIGTQMVNYGGTNGLDNLKEFVSFNALHDSSVQDPKRRCHPGTREAVLRQIRNWVEDSTITKRILWLHGPAGVGKSAIAQTIAHSYGQQAVAATFFFYRSDPSRYDGNRLFPTLTWQLAKSIPGLRECIVQALDNDADIPRKAVEVQFERLIAQTLQQIAAATAHGHMPVVIIDGVDECLDERLQERFLHILGKAAASSHFPLRFLVSSRPEALIKEVLNQFESTTLRIDLAEIEGAYSDIEKYLKAELDRIVTKQGINIDPWPTEDVIRDLTSRSSGQFVYASTVIKFVGDEYESATSQLDVIMGLQLARDGQSPFAELDALYVEVLRRQRDQIFLKDFLAIFVARSNTKVFSGSDDSLLLSLDEQSLHRKLRGMHSLLWIQPGHDINGHHRSFLDFLHEPTRSLEYHSTMEAGTRRYMELIIDSLVRYASTLMKQPSYHGVEHFKPAFSRAVRDSKPEIAMPLADWVEVLQPLLCLQAELFRMPNLTPPWKHGLCKECQMFRIIDDLLLHLRFYVGISRHSIPHAEGGLPYIDLSRLTLAQLDAQSIPRDTDGCLFPLLAILKEGRFGPSASGTALQFTRALLSSNHAETALKIRSILDAQTLIDFLFYLGRSKGVPGYCGPNGPRNVAQLALEVYARTPLLPQSLFLSRAEIVSSRNKLKYKGIPVKEIGYYLYDITLLCQGAFIWGVLSHDNISPLLGIYARGSFLAFVYQATENSTLRKWRQWSNPSAAEIQKRMLEVARAIQYVHSMGIVLMNYIDGNHIIVDSNSHSKVPGLGLSLRSCNEISSKDFNFFRKETWGYENNIFMFGRIFYEIYFDASISFTGQFYFMSDEIVKQKEPEISDVAWELIQRCCAEDAASRPTIDEVIAEMESWT